MTTADARTALPPKLEKLREMILFVLTAKEDHLVTDSHGRVPRTLTRMCGIPDTATIRGNVTTVLRHMEAEELIDRSTNADGRGTYEVRLLHTLSPGRMDEIKRKLANYQAVFKPSKASDTTSTPAVVKPLGIDQLQDKCQRAYTTLQYVAAQARRDPTTGYVVLSGRAALSAANIGNAEACKPIRYYLRKLGLARAVRKCNDGTSLWWWEVNTNALDLHALAELAAGEDSYEKYQERRVRTRKDALEKEFDDKCGPVTVRSVNGASAQVEPTADDAPQPAESSTIDPNGDPVMELLRIITVLERQIATLKEEHSREISELQKQLADALNTRAVRDEVVQAVIARHAGNTV